MASKYLCFLCKSLNFLGLIPYLLNKGFGLDGFEGPFPSNILWFHMDSGYSQKCNYFCIYYFAIFKLIGALIYNTTISAKQLATKIQVQKNRQRM